MIVNDMIRKAQEAYETSTRKDNRFCKFVQNYGWDECRDYEEDGLLFVKGRYRLECDGLDPFEMGWKPCVTSLEDLDFYYEF